MVSVGWNIEERLMTSSREHWWETSQNASFLIVAILIAVMTVLWVCFGTALRPPADLQVQQPVEPCGASS